MWELFIIFLYQTIQKRIQRLMIKCKYFLLQINMKNIAIIHIIIIANVCSVEAVKQWEFDCVNLTLNIPAWKCEAKLSKPFYLFRCPWEHFVWVSLLSVVSCLVMSLLQLPRVQHDQSQHQSHWPFRPLQPQACPHALTKTGRAETSGIWRAGAGQVTVRLLNYQHDIDYTDTFNSAVQGICF